MVVAHFSLFVATDKIKPISALAAPLDIHAGARSTTLLRALQSFVLAIDLYRFYPVCLGRLDLRRRPIIHVVPGKTLFLSDVLQKLLNVLIVWLLLEL